MAMSFAALIYRPEHVSERALSFGFGVSLAGYDLPKANLLRTELHAQRGLSVAFYQSGHFSKSSAPDATYEEFDHACELFDDELSPGRCVCDAAEHPEARVYTLVYSDEILHDDGICFTKTSFERYFTREIDEGVELGHVDVDQQAIRTIPLDTDETRLESKIQPSRGSAFLSKILGFSVISTLAQALFLADERLLIQLLPTTPEAVRAETQRLNEVLGRRSGRGAFELPKLLAGVSAPDTLQVFVEAYDWTDPNDPGDLYRELSIGNIDGTLHFMRKAELEAKAGDSAWEACAARHLYPIATLKSGLGSRAPFQTLALHPGGERLALADGNGNIREAGPTFAELLRYLTLGWKKRNDAEDDVIEALMLRAKVRTA